MAKPQRGLAKPSEPSGTLRVFEVFSLHPFYSHHKGSWFVITNLRLPSKRHSPKYKEYKYPIKICEGLKNLGKNMDWGSMFIQRNETGRVELLDFLMNVEWENPFATTLTMTTKHWRDVSQNFRHFMNRLNQRLLGNRFRRFGVRLRVLPILEGNEITNPHYHCVIDNPYPDRDEEFVNSIKRSWWKTELRKPEIHVEKMRDDGWITYIMKSRSKTSLLDSVDWQNTHI